MSAVSPTVPRPPSAHLGNAALSARPSTTRSPPGPQFGPGGRDGSRSIDRSARNRQAGRWLRWAMRIWPDARAGRPGACRGQAAANGSRILGPARWMQLGGTLTLGGVQVIVPADAPGWQCAWYDHRALLPADSERVRRRLDRRAANYLPRHTHGVDFARAGAPRPSPFDASGIAAGARPGCCSRRDRAAALDPERHRARRRRALCSSTAATFSVLCRSRCAPARSESAIPAPGPTTIGSLLDPEPARRPCRSVAPMVEQRAPRRARSRPAWTRRSRSPRTVELELQQAAVPAVDHGLDLSASCAPGNRHAAGRAAGRCRRRRHGCTPVTEALSGTASLALPDRPPQPAHVASLGNFARAAIATTAQRPPVGTESVPSATLGAGGDAGTPVGGLRLISVQPSQTVAEGRCRCSASDAELIDAAFWEASFTAYG